MLRKTSVIVIFALITFVSLRAQETFLYREYYLSQFVINPAITGAEYYSVSEISVKKQWLGIQNSPRSFIVSGNTRLGAYDFYDPKGFVNKGPLKLKDRVGLGAAIYGDQDGPINFIGLLLSYSYQFPVTDKSRLALGISATGDFRSVNNSMLNPNQPGDAYLYANNGAHFNPNFNLGVYYRAEDFFAGLSADKILHNPVMEGSNIKEKSSFFLLGGYQYLKKHKLSFESMLVVKKIGEENISLDFFQKAYIKRYSWVAVSYGTTQRLNVLFAVNIYRWMYLGYTFQYSLSKIAQYNFGSHQISFGINLGLIGTDGIRRLAKKDQSSEK